jgi:hypothetical protein
LVADELMIKSDDFLVGRLSGVGGWPVNPSNCFCGPAFYTLFAGSVRVCELHGLREGCV